MSDLIQEAIEDIQRKLSRLVLIDHRTRGVGRLFDQEGKIELSLQDDGKTLKIFITDPEEQNV
jgi:hypothetical protein